MKQLAEEEEKQLTERKETVERELKFLLLPKDPNDEKNVIGEIRAGTGGDEPAVCGRAIPHRIRATRNAAVKVEILEIRRVSLGAGSKWSRRFKARKCIQS